MSDSPFTPPSEERYLFNPFAGERDVSIKCCTVKIVTVRKQQQCYGHDQKTHGHRIKIGERARYEHALVDGEWGSYYICFGCMDRLLEELA